LDLFFQKAYSIVKPQGEILISDLHPERAANGSFARFKNDQGDLIKLSCIAHTAEAITTTAKNVGFMLNSTMEVFGDSELVDLNEKWNKYMERPMLQIWSFLR